VCRAPGPLARSRGRVVRVTRALAPCQLKEAERAQEAGTGVACKLVHQRECALTPSIFVCCGGELPFHVDASRLIDH